MSSCTVNQRPSSRLRLIGTLAGFLLLLASPSWSASVCYDEKFYPSVMRLEKIEPGVRVLLGGKFFNEGGQSYPKERLALQYSEVNGWKQDKSFSCSDGESCLPKVNRDKPGIPPITLSKEEAVALVPRLQEADEIEQTVSAWTEHNGAVWFGISFYAGEGTNGIGGVGRYDPKSGQTVIRRPKVLLESSINHIVHHGQWLWLGTTGYYECIGEPPAHGLIRYEWTTDRIETFEGKDDGPCGFVIHDLLPEKQYLWVATDLGLSRWDRQSKKWAHYVPDLAASPPMRPTTCAALYTSLLKLLPKTFDPQHDLTIFYSQLFDPLKRFRPQFFTSYVKAMPPADWGCDELKFLAEGMQDFQALKTNLLSHRPVGSPHFKCILEGFGGKKSRDLEWRDLLLSAFEKPGEISEYRDDGVLRFLSDFPGDTKAGEALAHRLQTASNPWQEAELLPAMLGSKSVPHLIQALDRFRNKERSDHILHALIKALVQATHVSISPNDVITSVPPNAEPDKYEVSDKALPRVVLHWKKWWETHKAQYGAGPVRPEPKQPEKNVMSNAKAIEPKVTLSAPTATLSIGTVYTLAATVKNLADPANPSLVNFPLRFQLIGGPHADLVKPLHGVTDSKGTVTFNYSGTRSGKDKITVTHEGDESFMEEVYTEVTWGGPDLVVSFFIPPVLMSGGGKTFFVSDWTQNIGIFPATASTTRYFLSTTNPANSAKARVIGERTVPALGPGEHSDVTRHPLTLPSDLPTGTYYLAACADASSKVLEADEQNNCSFHKIPGQAVIVAPSISIEKAVE